MQTGSQRTSGFELGVTGNVTPAWQIAAGYAYQDAEITSGPRRPRPAPRSPVVPQHTLSLWNRYQSSPRVAWASGVIYQDEMFAAIDNTVTLPSFTRFDAAAFFTLNEHLRAAGQRGEPLRRGVLHHVAQQQQHHARARRGRCGRR